MLLLRMCVYALKKLEVPEVMPQTMQALYEWGIKYEAEISESQ